jgi:hypothetical protein
VQGPLEDLVRLLLHRERELALAHRAREDFHEVPVHDGAYRAVGDKGSAKPRVSPRPAMLVFRRAANRRSWAKTPSPGPCSHKARRQ